jgi:hypothetical protein
MVELEQELQDQESDLLAQIPDLENKARSYEESLDELASTNTDLREHCASRSWESKPESTLFNDSSMLHCCTRRA